MKHLFSTKVKVLLIAAILLESHITLPIWNAVKGLFA